MRRICTQSEKEILKLNKQDIISDTINEKNSRTMVAVVLGVIIGFAIGIPLVFVIRSTDVVLNQVILYSILAIAISFMHFIFKGKSSSRMNDKIYDGDIVVSGGTIIGFNPKNKFIMFVEDGIKDSYGRPYRISVPAKKFDGIRGGDRVLIVSITDGPYFIMSLNDQTRDMIPYYSDIDINAVTYNNLWFPVILPHPNAIYLDPQPRWIDQEEREALKVSFSNHNEKTNKVLIGFINGCIIFVFAMIYIGNLLSLDISGAAVFIAPIVMLITVFIISKILVAALRKTNTNNINKVAKVQKVVVKNMKPFIAGIYGQQELVVYANLNGKLMTRNIPNPQLKGAVNYGDLLYMYDTNRMTYFVKIEDNKINY